ncbi:MULTISPECIES: HypC/HybG/HupF family hydrogenase formation chaperone [Thiorhodovibrio]|uniref:HypC/HybG/HupF family hydrogenase formation chaperone n=1 Tax=Thiorhodovibrio TaxID=61593 RepID=UPI001914C3B7|nr:MULTISPECIES: HypC/HybG/HupF family hydrogenase formation chaperone [Thiorhodovibrio]MBK5970095.1 hydrogenase [Thiorhodovibrio winogradskyi]WPL13477.1 Hydrogenase isoenzymes formation protein HypC [Thiorhodovibrio litoralis]
MCLAIPAQVLDIDSATDMASVSLDGVRKDISLALVENVQIGDYVLVHVGYALNRISPEEAEETLRLMRSFSEFTENPPGQPATSRATAAIAAETTTGETDGPQR